MTRFPYVQPGWSRFTIGRSIRGSWVEEGTRGTVILRLIRGRADRQRLAALHAALQSKLGGGGAESTVPVRWHLGTRGSGDEQEVLLLASWASAEDAADADRRGLSPWRIGQGHLEGARVEHFEVDTSLLRRTGREPIAIRVATGRFSHHGTDIAMQELLRERLPAVGDELCEAYVGRRLDGRAVEITFVSLWQRRPDGRSLEEPFWPDIALRYDAFSVEVYETGG